MGVGPETRLVNRIRAAILERHPGSWVVKVAGGPYQTAGIPDLLVCVQGRLLGIEVKAPRKGESMQALLRRVTPRQRATIRALTAAGAVAGVAHDVESALALVERSVSSGA